MNSGRSGTDSWPYPTLIAHRGGGIHAPENTLAAMKTGYLHSYTMAEFDVKLSSDSVALLMHDSTLDRTTNGHGPVMEKTMAVLEQLDAGSWHSESFRGEPVPRFSTVAQYLHGLGMMANVEIKPCAGREVETGRMVGSLCVDLWRDRFVKPLISSFSVDSLVASREAAPDLPIGLLVREPGKDHFAVLESMGCVSIHCDHRFVDAGLVRLFHDHNYRVMVYTVNEPNRVSELLALGVDGIFTDQLELMAKKFAQHLADTGRKIADPPDAATDWQAVAPPMP